MDSISKLNTCKFCGSSTYNKKFCSLACYGKYCRDNKLRSGKNNPCYKKNRELNPNSNGRYVACGDCGKLIWRSQYELNHKANHFCSRECMGKWQSINRKGEKSPMYNSYKIKCSVCGNIVEVNKYKLDNTNNICCSYECSDKLKSFVNKGVNNPNYGNTWSDDQRNIARDRTIKQFKKGSFSKCDTLPERLVENWLLFNGFYNYVKQFPYKLGIADFYLQEFNLIIEVYGDYWHNLPNYKKRDEKKNEYLRQSGYDVKVLWELDIYNDIERCMSWIQ